MDLHNESLTTKAIYGASVSNSVKFQANLSSLPPPTSSGLMKNGINGPIEGDMSSTKPVVSIGKTGIIHKRL